MWGVRRGLPWLTARSEPALDLYLDGRSVDAQRTSLGYSARLRILGSFASARLASERLSGTKDGVRIFLIMVST